MEWLDKIETMLSIIASTFTGTIILAGDTSINVNEPSRSQKWYQEILENFNLAQHINLPTRKGSKIIDHIITNIPSKILYSNVLPCPSISDHDALYIIAKIPTNKYQPRFKFMRHMKNVDLQKQIKVRTTFEKDKISLDCIQKSKKRNHTENEYNKSIILQKHFEFKEHEKMESHSQYSKSKKYNFRRKRK